MLLPPPGPSRFPYTTLFRSRQRRGLKFRRRDDYAVELFREAQANLGDLRRVDRILLELGRFYNPYINARSEEHTSELQSLTNLVCRLLLETKNRHARTR